MLTIGDFNSFWFFLGHPVHVDEIQFYYIFPAHYKFPWEYSLLCFGNMSVHG